MEESFLTYVEDLTCCVLSFANFPRRRHFPAYSLSLTVLAGGVLNAVGYVPSIPNFLVFIYYLLGFCMLLVIFHFCFRSSWEQVLCRVNTGRATQHLIYQILQLIGLKIDPAAYVVVNSQEYILGALLTYVPFCVAAYALFARKIDAFDLGYEKDEFHMRTGLLSVVMVLVYVGITRLMKSVEDHPESAVIAESLYAIICCLLCPTVLFEFNRRAKLTKGMEMVRMLWKKDSKQLAEWKDAIELINTERYDIRHKLEDYHLSLTNDKKREIKFLIQIYGQTYRTGSQTLDVLLADRVLLYEKDHIQLDFLRDGECLNFLTESEIFSLFNNALGSAVGASRNLEEAKRQISIVVKRSDDLTSISMTNYYRDKLRFESGLPVTTRPDPEDFHGYDPKDMQAIAREYGSRLKVKAEDGIFSLAIRLVDNQTQWKTTKSPISRKKALRPSFLQFIQNKCGLCRNDCEE